MYDYLPKCWKVHFFNLRFIEIIFQLKRKLFFVFQVTQDHQGGYQCTPYNSVGTAGVSGVMEVYVREPPVFTNRPKPIYQRRVGDDIIIPCEAHGRPRPDVSWRRVSYISMHRPVK